MAQQARLAPGVPEPLSPGPAKGTARKGAGKRWNVMNMNEMEKELELTAVVVDKLQAERFEAKQKVSKKRGQIKALKERLLRER